MTEHEIDEVTGQQTTGHEWDGIKELNSPIPRWWLYTFYVTIAWGIAFMIAMPSIPLVNDYTKGVLGYSQRAAVRADIEEARADQSAFRDRIEQSSLEEIRDIPDLFDFAVAGGKSAFSVNCSQCHGAGGAGAPGFPNLNDDAWIWGGKPAEILDTIRVGIRSDHPDTRFNQMPAFLADELLTREEVSNVVEYVLKISDQSHERDAAARGQTVFREQCWPMRSGSTAALATKSGALCRWPGTASCRRGKTSWTRLPASSWRPMCTPWEAESSS